MLCLEIKIPMKNQFKHHFGISSFLTAITRVMTLSNTVNTNCNITGAQMFLGSGDNCYSFSGSWGAQVIIFRDLGSKLIVLGIYGALPFSRDLTIPHLDLSHFALCIMGN